MDELRTQLKLFFDKSFREFLVRESQQIYTGISERNLCGQLMLTMEQNREEFGFADYIVEVEYNRKQGGAVKTMLGDRQEVIRINCDLVLHSRGKKIANDNLIAVEMKKADRPQSQKNSDRKRLRILTKESYDGIWSADGNTHPEHVCGYKIGVYIELDIANRKCLSEFYAKGDKISEQEIIVPC